LHAWVIFHTFFFAVASPPKNIEGKQTTFISSKGGVVTFGPNVTFGSKSVVTIGRDTTIVGGTVQGPGAVKPVIIGTSDKASLSGQIQPDQEKLEGVIFAKSANAPCKRAGSKLPIKVLPNIKKPISVGVGKSGEIVVSVTGSPSIITFDDKYNKMAELHDRSLSHCCIAIDNENNILAFGTQGIKKFNMSGQELLAVSKCDKRDLQFRTPHAVAIGKKGQMYIADIGSKMVHILDRDFNNIKSFADNCVAFGIAISTEGNVYVPDLKNNTIRVFTSEGDLLFVFGGPGRNPLPHLSLVAPTSVAIDSNNMVYVGTGMGAITVFDKEGNFQDKIGSRGKEPGQFHRAPAPLYIDKKSDLYAGDQGGDTLQVFQIEQ